MTSLQVQLYQDHVLGRFIAVRNDSAPESDTGRRDADKLGVGLSNGLHIRRHLRSLSNSLFPCFSHIDLSLSSLCSMFVTSSPYYILFLFPVSGGL